MNEQLFDAMLRTALEEALEEDCREAPAEQKHTGHTSLRQRRRMRRMLADPWGYERRSRAAKQMEAQQKMQVKTPVRHLRWPVLAAAVLLLTVSVTGYALRLRPLGAVLPPQYHRHRAGAGSRRVSDLQALCGYPVSHGPCYGGRLPALRGHLRHCLSNHHPQSRLVRGRGIAHGAAFFHRRCGQALSPQRQLSAAL